MSTTTLPFVPMRPDTIDLETKVGRVLVPVQIVSLGDLWEVERGLLTESEVRRIDVPDALVDTGCTLIGLPTRMIEQLNLNPAFTRPIRSAAGLGITTVYGTVQLTIQGRSCVTDVFEVSNETPVLIGQVPLELLDFVVDPQGRRLIGNPAHGGEWQLDAY